jgi:hypothetical protein
MNRACNSSKRIASWCAVRPDFYCACFWITKSEREEAGELLTLGSQKCFNSVSIATAVYTLDSRGKDTHEVLDEALDLLVGGALGKLQYNQILQILGNHKLRLTIHPDYNSK